MKTSAMLILVVLVAAIVSTDARADVSIYTIQYTTAADGASSLDGNTVDCLGGIVTHKIGGYYPRVYLYDPANPDGWGGIVVKGWNGEDTFAGVALGAWISLSNVDVEDYRGTTFLQYRAGSSLATESTGHVLPPPITLTADKIAAPLPVGENWLVAGHSAEKYESMLLRVSDLTVTEMHLGKADDIYNLQDSNGDDLWATDYNNADKVSDDWPYLPAIATGEHFASVTGILEQYTKGDLWDYYQLLTRTADDVVVPEPATISMLLVMASLVVLRWSRLRKR